MSQLPLLFQNQDFVSVNKPTGLSVHNEESQENLLLLLQKQLKVPQLFPAHRLDKETSGVQILALNSSAAHKLAQQFQDKNVVKIYHGLLRGRLATSEGLWKQPLTDKAEGRKNPQGIAKNRVPCETRYRVIESSKYFSYCEFQLITGRQHQIRKHAALAGHALVGDSRYGDPRYNQKVAEIYKTDRLFLHCHRLEISGQNLLAEIPEDFNLIHRSQDL